MEKAIRSEERMVGARLVVSTSPEGIDANCSDALFVEANGVVRDVQQKRVLEAICRRYTTNTISVYGSGVGIRR